MIRVVASSHYYRPVADGDTLQSLDAKVGELCKERYRRIDRFVQLALVGAAECAKGVSLSPNCGLYLASSIGPIGSNVLVQDAIHREHKLPMPFSFVNTLGSSACFHVAKDLGLAGEAVLVARAGGSFAAALQCALADLESGIVNQMLVGAVEECLLPGARQRLLLRQDESVTIAEGSHWMLLERTDTTGASVAEASLADAQFDGYEARDAAIITSHIARTAHQPFGFEWSRDAITLVALQPARTPPASC